MQNRIRKLTLSLWLAFWMATGLNSPLLAQSPTPNVPLRLRIGTFDPAQAPSDVPVERASDTSSETPGLWLVQFPAPIEDDWYTFLGHAGLDIVAYIPDYAYVVWGDATAVIQTQTTLPLRWAGKYLPTYALHPALDPEQRGYVDVLVQLYAHDEIEKTTATIQTQSVRTLRTPYNVLHYRNLGVRIDAASLTWLASLPGVVSVEPIPNYRLLDEIQGQILAGNLTPDGSQPSGPGYLQWLTGTVGFTTTAAAYPIVDITDDGIDDGDDSPAHPDFFELGDIGRADRLVYNHNWTSDPLADGAGGHGNLNAGVVGGYNDLTGFPYEDGNLYNYGLGINPFGLIAGSKIFRNSGPYEAPPYTEIISTSYGNGARISSNSWGSDGTGEYLLDDQEYDTLVRDAQPDMPGNQEILILFAAGNYGAGGSGTIGSPANAKNVVSVGAAENYRPTWTDGCGYGPASANNAHDIASFSSRGPTDDGRVKPDLVAPGTHIIGPASQITNYTGDYVCDKYFPSGQTLYASSSGTSHATPAVAGAASLLYRYYQDHFGDVPSPAMSKAYLINSTRYLDGASSGDTLPSNNQGYGEVNLGLAFDGAPHIVHDQQTLLTRTGNEYTLSAGVADPAQSIRLTLAWSDAPGATTGGAYVNNLDLSVEIQGETYLGNVFSGPTSTTGGSPDTVNNVESIFLPAGLSGTFTVTVMATNIAGDGVPGNSDPTDQDFALVCYNCLSQDDFTLAASPVQQEICAPDEAVYTLTTDTIMGFDDMLALRLDNRPGGSLVTIEPNPIPAGDNAQITISNTAAVTPGRYLLDVVATAATREHSTTVQLDLFNGVPATADLLSPSNGAINVTRQPTLTWTPDTSAARATLEVATNTQFSPLVYSATVEATGGPVRHRLPIALETGATYYWRVTGSNACGSGATSPVYHFITHAPPITLCGEPLMAIPDNDPVGVTTTLTLTENGSLLDLDVVISVTHTWVGDLSLTLERLEDGARIALVDRPGNPTTSIGCSGDDINVRLDDDAELSIEDDCSPSGTAYTPGASYRPNDPLATFNGHPLGGTWALHVEDHNPMDEGVLQFWCLIATPKQASVAFVTDRYTTTRESGSAPITVTLNVPAAITVSVDYATHDAAAIAGTHYLSSSGTLTFTPGVLTRTFDVPILDGAPHDGDKDVLLALSRPNQATLVLPQTAVLSILDPTKLIYLPLVLKGVECSGTLCLP